jgi:hypothetical protein
MRGCYNGRSISFRLREENGVWTGESQAASVECSNEVPDGLTVVVAVQGAALGVDQIGRYDL